MGPEFAENIEPVISVESANCFQWSFEDNAIPHVCLLPTLRLSRHMISSLYVTVLWINSLFEKIG